jgi:rubrerythrin
MEKETSQLSRRSLLQGAAVGAAALVGAGVLAACTPAATNTPSNTSSTTTPDASKATDSADAPLATVLDPKKAYDYKTATNFNIVVDNTTKVGTTAENLMSAITGETGATTKYTAFAAAAKNAGYDQIARLFEATAAAEAIHIELEFAELKKMDANAVKPTPPTVEAHATDVNLILGANGEIYETADMYPSFIKVAIDEKQDAAAAIFARAKLAESVHAERYMDAYNRIDNPDSDKYYLCPECGYIHKGENIKACPICLTAKSAFKAY